MKKKKGIRTGSQQSKRKQTTKQIQKMLFIDELVVLCGCSCCCQSRLCFRILPFTSCGSWKTIFVILFYFQMVFSFFLWLCAKFLVGFSSLRICQQICSTPNNAKRMCSCLSFNRFRLFYECSSVPV